MSSFVEFDGLSKRFGGVVALRDASFSVARGTCHALMGENGAGKSTLSKILAGIHRPDSGQLRIDGMTVHFRSPRDALLAGVGMVHQELSFCRELSVAENLCLGRYPKRWGVVVSRSQMKAEALRQLSEIGLDLDVEQPMRQLSTAQEQLVQIAAAVATGARLVIFDEPTSSLSEGESRHLFKLIASLRDRGVTMIYISHRLPEVLKLCDRISILRDGVCVGTLEKSEATEERLIQMMIGRAVGSYFPNEEAIPATQMMLEATKISSPGKFTDISFQVRAGEILGMAGLVGAGRSEIAQAIFGLDHRVTGEMALGGKPFKPRSVLEAMRAGIGLVPEDRKHQGLVLMLSCRENFALSNLDRFQRRGVIDRRRERNETEIFLKKLAVRVPGMETPVHALSGGNQQKVVMAKWLARPLKLLILDEPTRGVDVGAKAAIHELIIKLAQEGMAVLLISSELPEILHLSSRILVLREGRLTGELPRSEANEDKLLRLMSGVPV